MPFFSRSAGDKSVKNVLLYTYHIAGKTIAFIIFGAGTALISVIIFPLLRLFNWNKKNYQRAGRHFISLMFRFLIKVVSLAGLISVSVTDKNRLNKLKSAIVVSNHPSLIDVVILIALMPSADCIVNSHLKKNIVGYIIRQLYITNDTDFEEMKQKCLASLNDGNCLIIFPEGTRSLREGQNPYKKGAARISLYSHCPVLPVYIGGNDKTGLRKHDSFFTYNPKDTYRYILSVKDELYPADYSENGDIIGARKMTEAVRNVLSDFNNASFIIRD